MFGEEPAHSAWCYYFEKADLAKQYGDWQQVAALGDQARAEGYSPRRSSSDAPQEWRPFIEGYATLGRWQDAMDLSVQAGERDADAKTSMCTLWGSLQKALPAGVERDQAAAQVMAELGCGG